MIKKRGLFHKKCSYLFKQCATIKERKGFGLKILVNICDALLPFCVMIKNSQSSQQPYETLDGNVTEGICQQHFFSLLFYSCMAACTLMLTAKYQLAFHLLPGPAADPHNLHGFYDSCSDSYPHSEQKGNEAYGPPYSLCGVHLDGLSLTLFFDISCSRCL